MLLQLCGLRMTTGSSEIRLLRLVSRRQPSTTQPSRNARPLRNVHLAPIPRQKAVDQMLLAHHTLSKITKATCLAAYHFSSLTVL